MANTVGSLLIRIGASIGDLQKGLDKAERSMMRFGNKMQNIGTQLSATVSLPIIGMGAAALKAFGDMEKLEKGMTTIMGSSEAASTELEKLKKAAEAPGLGFEQAVAGSIRLQAVGMSADQARETLVQFGNAIATTGGNAEDLDQVTRQLTQMISKNRILQEDFMVLQERMPLVSQAMQQAFGHSNIELIRKSGMSAQDFVARLTQELGTFQRVEGGFSNAFENMQMAVKSAMGQIGEAINNSLDVTGKMEKFAMWVQRLADWFDGLGESQKRFIVIAGVVAAAIGPVLIGISSMAKMASMAVMGFKSLLGVFAIITSPIGLIVAGIAALAAGFAYAYNKSEKFRATINGVGAVLMEVVKIMGEAVRAFVDGFASLKEGEFRKAAASFQEALVKANPISMAFAEGGRLAKAYSDGVEKSLARSAQEKAFDPYKDKEKILANAKATGIETGKAFSEGVATSSGGGGLQGFEGIGSAVQGLAGNKQLQVQSQSTFAAIAGYIKNPIDLMKQGGDVVYTWIDKFDMLSDSVSNFAANWGGAFQGINDIIGLAFQNREASINAFYDAERKRIEGSKMNEAAKQKAMQKLEEDTDKKRRKMARAQAIRDKILGIIQATIATARAVAQSLPNIPLSIIAGAIGAAQIALIASQKIPALAKGGLAYGPSMAMVGDNKGARVNPEVIAPLDTLLSMLGGGAQQVYVTGVIRGKDLLLIQERAQQDRIRTRGF